MNSNLINIYMDYKINRLQKYGLLILDQTDPFVESCFQIYLTTYVQAFYYHQFDTIDSSFCSDLELQKELDGKYLEILDQLAEMELLESNHVYEQKKKWTELSKKISLFLICLDRQRYENKDSILEVVGAVVRENSDIQTLLGERIFSLGSMVRETYLSLEQFFSVEDDYYQLVYNHFPEREKLVSITMKHQIKLLEANYKKTLVERVYQDPKLIGDKFLVLIRKFVKNFLFDSYYQKPMMDKYFIELPEVLFEDKKLVEEIFNLVHNPFLSRYLVFSIPSSVLVTQSIFRNYSMFSFACIQDLSHINDVTSKLTTIDTCGLYEYVIISNYKAKDKEEIEKYIPIGIDILFGKDV